MSNTGWMLMLLVPGLLLLGVPMALDYLRKRRLAQAMNSLAQVLGKPEPDCHCPYDDCIHRD